MNLTITKQTTHSDGLSADLLQSFLRTQGLYCTVASNTMNPYNSCHRFYDFTVSTRYGLGTGNETPEIAKYELKRRLLEVASIQDWKIECNIYAYFQDSFPDKVTGIRLWVYVQGDE